MRQIIREDRGQSMLEMALVLPVLLALVFGIIEFGNIYSTKIEMNNLSRQAVRTAVVKAVADYGGVEDDVEEIAVSLGMETATVSIVPSADGSDVIATVTYSAPLITGQIIGKETMTLKSEATMKAE